MQVVVLHNEPGDQAAADEQDVLTQRDAVMTALESLGHDAVSLSCSLDLETVRRELTLCQPDVVFNLVEALGGTDRLMSIVPLLLDGLRIPYTGAGTQSMLAASGKLESKRRLRDSGLATPPWLDSSSPRLADDASCEDFRWILKPVWEHASVGMDDNAVVDGHTADSLQEECRLREELTGRPYFAERFIDGREFNLSLLADSVLPPAEIDFSKFPAGKPRIVGQRAKWEQNSFEYRQTPRTFNFATRDEPLLDRLRQDALRCWHVFELTGFARVDFRVDPEGQPWILEVNVNPCLSPDAGFAAALLQAGISFETAVQRILGTALSGKRAHVSHSANLR